MSVTDLEFKSALETAIKKCCIAKGLKKTPAVEFLADALHVGKRRIYSWLGDDTSPHRRDQKYKDIQEFIRQCDSSEIRPREMAPVQPAPVHYSVNSAPLPNNITIPILANIPMPSLKEDQIGEISVPLCMVPGFRQDYYALELRATAMDFPAGDLAIVKRQADVGHSDWVVVGAAHGYTFMRLNDLILNKERFSIHGVVAAIFHKVR